MFNKEQLIITLHSLIARYQTIPDLTLENESNIRANFIDPLFETLGWPIHDRRYYNREEYVRGVGFADIALKTDPKAKDPLIFVEAKPFGRIQPLAKIQAKRDREAVERNFHLPGMTVDRTREEQQVINYAYQKGIEWAILTNFEHFRLFNARRDTLVLNFEGPADMIHRVDELWQLAFSQVQYGSLATLRSHRERQDVDEEYLGLVNVWRLRLGQNILTHRENRLWLTDKQTGQLNVQQLRDAVQRILDRLVVIRFAEDRLVIPTDQLRSLLEVRERTLYSFPLLDQIRYFFQQFNVHHNGSLFAEHLCDRLTIDEEVLQAIIFNLYDARFRSMSADIMGNTYEQYLGQTLVLKNGDVETADNLETRKAQGSYYTPEPIVQYVVDQTVGRYLYGTENGKPGGRPLGPRKFLADIDGTKGHLLTILDPSCGSGSFLMATYYVLEGFYEAEIARITQERDEQLTQLTETGLSPFEMQLVLVTYTRQLEQLKVYKNLILERHLYGVDLDPQAAELAAVNLMLRGLTRGVRLPLILNQNVQVGNSLVGRLYDAVALSPHAGRLAQLRRLRLVQQGVIKDSRHPLELQGEIERLVAELNLILEGGGGDLGLKQAVFNWQIVFPELFVDEAGYLRPDGGFTFVLGNPPYLSVDDTLGQQSAYATYLKNGFADIWAGKSDMYYYFFRRGLALLAPAGQLGFVTARYYLEAHYAGRLRQILLQDSAIEQIIDFGDYPAFPKVGTKTAITILTRQPSVSLRQQNRFLFARIPHKQINFREFLSQVSQTAESFAQADLSDDSWNLYGQDVGRLIAKMDNGAKPLGQLCFIGQGMQTGNNAVFVIDRPTRLRHRLEPQLIRKLLKNQDIDRYRLAFRSLYLIYPEAVPDLTNYPNGRAYLESHQAELEKRAAFQRGDCEWWRFTWPLHRERYDAPKLITPFISSKNRFALDEKGEFIGLTDTYVLFGTAQSPDLRYLLALLNSRLLNFRYRYIGKAKDYRYEYAENSLSKIPIRLADEPTTQQLVNLAQQMITFSQLGQLVQDEFNEVVEATGYERHNFYEAYYTHNEYRPLVRRVGPAGANLIGTVNQISLAEEGDHLMLWGRLEGIKPEQLLLTLEIAHQPLRHFLALAIRADLALNERKKVWARGAVLGGVLRALRVPVLNGATAKANLAAIEQVMAEVGERVSVHPIPSLSDIEKRLAVLDQQIDEIVYDIYDLRPDEISLLDR